MDFDKRIFDAIETYVEKYQTVCSRGIIDAIQEIAEILPIQETINKETSINVYLVASTYDYEGTTIAGVFSSEHNANAFITKQRKLCSEFMEDQERTDYSSELKTPKCNGESIEILKYKIDEVDHYKMNFKNLTFDENNNYKKAKCDSERILKRNK